FLQVTEDALDAGAALRVSNGTELGVQLGLLLAEPARRESMGVAAKAFWFQRRGATAATLAALGDLLQF
ncbi:MAG: 3-deoxy-D-manno-octulosonic acid transferase, partial [Betaproteobacteria bacterium]|nr:3-deoxy-D-manno-octulosonic acid transferase [Betaproteobacteria bacterium]